MKNKKLYGLVLAGGKSTRMGKDKASLEYFGKKQAVVCYELLSRFCEKVFISNRMEQALKEGQKGFPQIHDKAPFLSIGPLGGILSAMATHPKVSWLVLACDLPYVNKEVIKDLLKKRNQGKLATAYASTYDNLPEPLCTVYEAHSRRALLKYFKDGGICPRKFLMNHNVELLTQELPGALDNVNTLKEYKEALKKALK